GTVDHDYDVESGAPQAADEAAEAGANPLSVARAHPAPASDTDSAGGRTNVVVGADHGLARVRVDLPGLFHRQRLQLRHLHLGHIGVFAGLGLAAPAAGLQADRNEVLTGFDMYGKEQEQQDHDVQADRERKRAQHE